MSFCKIIIFPLIVICLISGCGKKTAVDTVKDYITYLGNNNVSKAKNLCTYGARETFDNIQSDFEVGKAMQVGAPGDGPDALAPKPLNVDDLSFTPAEQGGESTLIIVKSEDQEVTFELMFIGGSWKIQRISNPLFGMEHLIDWDD